MSGPSADPAVRLHGVRKAFGEGRTRVDVLKGIDLEIAQGELFMLVGPSGSGKSTLLSVMTGLLEFDVGEIEVLGRRMDRMTSPEKTAFRRDNVGFVFQQYLLLPTLSALENAAVPLFNRGVPRRQALKDAGRWLEEIGLGARMHAPPAKLSGGEQQRVAIARALVTEPRLLVCDEPTANLDGETGLRVMEILRERALKPDRALLVVTHDMRNYRFGDRIAQMLDGRIEQVHAITQEDRTRLMQESGGWPWAARSA